MTNAIVSSSNETLNPRIWIGCLAAYNGGDLHGEWIDATQSVEALFEDIQTILAQSPDPDAEEWAIFDYDDFWCDSLGEYENLEDISVLANLLEKHGRIIGELYDYCSDLSEVQTMIKEHYQGEWESEQDFASEQFDECYLHDIPEYVQGYINYEGFTRDLFINDYVSFRINGKEHVFSNL